jgi:hypothetical protein
LRFSLADAAYRRRGYLIGAQKMTDAILASRKSISGEAVLTSSTALSNEAADSAVSWAAILAGAFAATAFTIALVALGAGIGLVSVSPWSHDNVSVTTFGMLAAAWFIAVQLFASGLGGYLAGRLRTRWVGVHTDEVYFRDTAHGLMVWAVGAVVSALVLSSAASSLAGGVGRAGAAAVQAVGAAAAGPASQVAGQATSSLGDPTAYFTDMLFRTDHPAASGDTAATMAEIGRIFTRALTSGDLPAADKTYVAQVVASRTGLNQADAEKRVTDVFDQAKSAAAQAADKVKAAADAARKTGIYVSLWAFASLLVGAFAASYMATVGGRTRDEELISG